MTEFLYCIVDQRNGNFNNVFLSQNNEKAKRHFEALLLMPESQMSLFPADHYLTCLGSYDNVTGKFTNEENIKPICTGVELAMQLKQNISSLKNEIDFVTCYNYLRELQSYGRLPAHVVRALAGEALPKEQSDPLSNPPAEPASHEERKASVLGIAVSDEANQKRAIEEKII